jgi:hypothetical protein
MKRNEEKNDINGTDTFGNIRSGRVKNKVRNKAY